MFCFLFSSPPTRFFLFIHCSLTTSLDFCFVYLLPTTVSVCVCVSVCEFVCISSVLISSLVIRFKLLFRSNALSRSRALLHKTYHRFLFPRRCSLFFPSRILSHSHVAQLVCVFILPSLSIFLFRSFPFFPFLFCCVFFFIIS